MLKVLKSSIVAGIAIGIAGFGYLALSSKGTVGAICGAELFACGLIAVILYKLKLYTGAAGFVTKESLVELPVILLGNVIGCFLVGTLSRLSPMDMQAFADKVLETRLNTGILANGLLAIGCGFLMTTAVCHGRKGNLIPTFFCVPMFIVCGFPHCIADSFYYLACSFDYLAANVLPVLLTWLSIVVGNFIGCNIYRIFGI